MTYKTLDGNEAVARIAYQLNEVIAIYPITPSSPMGEWSDIWAASQKPNLWGSVPSVIEMQSEGGAAGSVHGALQAGSLTTTFTASQGLLLMLPNMYKIAGELTPAVFHVAARSIAAQGLSIFGDHSDVMAARSTGFAMLASGSVQEAMDFALIAQAASLKSRLPFLAFFDGFRTSHEIAKVKMIDKTVLESLIDEKTIAEHRERALSPDHPVLRGTAQNPDVYFQARETVNPYYDNCLEITQNMMDEFAKLSGRQYHIYEYDGVEDAEHVIVLMGSGAETAHECVEILNQKNYKVGILKVRLYRPFNNQLFLKALPKTVKKIAVLDRTKEPGSSGEPLYLDCVNALQEGFQEGWIDHLPVIVGGRYGLSSKEFTPAMVKAIFDNLQQNKPKNHFTIGIYDDVSNSSLDFEPEFSTESDKTYRALFYGLGSDGTVGANKNTIKIIGENTDNYAQGYFVYDSKKAGATTISHLRFGPEPIRSAYLIDKANFIGCHQDLFLERYNLLEKLQKGGIFLLNTHHNADDIWQYLPRVYQKELIKKQIQFYVINAYKVARESGIGHRTNTVMQTCFFHISGILPQKKALQEIKTAIKNTYQKKGDDIVEMNLRAVDHTLTHLHQVKLPESITSTLELTESVPPRAPEFVRQVLSKMIEGKGDQLPVSALPTDGTYPTGTAQWEKRNLAYEIPVWDPEVCIQCGKCALVCPHGVIRIKAYEEKYLENTPATFKSCDSKDKDWQGLKYTIQVAPEDCTGCAVCVDICPAKNKSQTRLKAINMSPQAPLREEEKRNWEFFLNLPELERNRINPHRIRQQQVQQPLFEFSGACAGCGETPYIKLMTQLFGDRAIVANATGCSSIYGGNLPTTPWSFNQEGRGPAWSNSLFEDNAEFGLGMRMAVEQQTRFARELLDKLKFELGTLAKDILNAEQQNETEIYEQRERVKILREKLERMDDSISQKLLTVIDALVKRSVWIIGGDGWAYDIGFGGLDHVLASGKNVNILVLDTEVYSNTGGQMSKSTPRAAIAKFASNGKSMGKKDLGMMAMSYGHVYVAQVAMGAKDEQTLKAFIEAESYPGPSLIIAYSHCIAHGINMTTAFSEHKAKVKAGQWLLYRYDPRRLDEGLNPLQLDCKAPKIPAQQILYKENRFKMLTRSHPKRAKELLNTAQNDINKRWKQYQEMAKEEK